MNRKNIFKRILQLFSVVILAGTLQILPAYGANAQNPIIWADVPDVSVIRVGSNYYMSSTTMHMNPGVPIMKSTNLVNWEVVNYVYPTLGNGDKENLNNGQNEYGKGSWASTLRYKNGIYYVAFMSYTSNNTYIYQTSNIETGPWTRYALGAAYHDSSLLFDDDGRVYLVYGAGDIRVVELTSDAKAVKSGGLQKILIANAGAIAGSGGLAAEGAHVHKINGKYYIFLISWPTGGSRTELVYRADTFAGTYQGQVLLSNGVAQGGVVDTPDGKWYAMLFRDSGAVGRIPSLIPVTWNNNWPVLGSITDTGIPVSLGSKFAACDGFDSGNKPGLMWQWNHNPDNNYWSYNTARAGYFRLTNGSVRANILAAKNTLTQRTFGGESSAIVALETGGMKDGDYAGLSAFQFYYGFAGVKMSGTSKYIVMVRGNTNDASQTSTPVEVASLPLNQNRVYLKVYTDFRNRTDKAYFYYSLDGNTWTAIGSTLQMAYTLPHFMGYRFGLFTYATKSTGGYADFDYFTLSPAPAGGCSIGTPVNTPTSTPCGLTAITPYLQVNGAAWQQTNAVSVVSLPAAVNLGPQPVTGGSWSWSGPNGFTSTLRQIENIPLSVGTNVFTATYTNACGAKSTQVFTITVQGPAATFTATNTAVPPVNTFTKTNTPVTPSATPTTPVPTVTIPTATPTAVIASTWRVLAGSVSPYTDSFGNVWAADTNYNSGTAYNTTAVISNTLPGAADQALYQTERYGNTFTYTFNVPSGAYQITLKMAETYWTAAGQRMFNLSINGTQALSGFDLYTTAGGTNTALDLVYNNISPVGGTIVIQFGPASVDNAKICAIQIIPQPIVPTEIPTTPAATNTPIVPIATSTIPVPTNTPIVPTATPTTPVPTNTPIVPTATPTTPVPTNTPVVPTATPTTPVPTDTPIVPTVTPTTPVPTNTPVVPTATPTIPATANITLHLKSADTNSTTSSPHPHIRIVNSGTAALNMNNVEARYWLSYDGTGQGVQAFVDWAGKMPQGTGVTGNVLVSVAAKTQGTQTHYMSIKFTGGLILQPGESVEIQTRINKTDWSSMLQSNDWSYAAYTSFTMSNRITGYVSGAKVWGDEPSAAVSGQAAQVSSVLSYPNPSTGDLTTLSYTIAGTGITALDTNYTIPDPDATVTLKIFTISGRKVWEKSLSGVQNVSAGTHIVSWDGKSSGGVKLAAGTYTLNVKVNSNGETNSKDFVIIMLK